MDKKRENTEGGLLFIFVDEKEKKLWWNDHKYYFCDDF
jgi:hypothetical protein